MLNLVLALLAGLAVTMLSLHEAQACTCLPTTVKSGLRDADVVFEGRVIAVRTERNPGGPKAPAVRVAVFDVSRVWKGDAAQKIEVQVGGGICQGFPPNLFAVGNEVLVYAYKFKGSAAYMTTICTRTKLASQSTDFRELGSGATPKKQ